MSYADKLREFNKSEKYNCELEFLRGLIISSCDNDALILDYGCGNGSAIEYMVSKGMSNIHGHDVNKHSPNFNYSSPDGRWDLVYFMHSFAHIKNIEQVLIGLDCSTIVIITPNQSWLRKQYNKRYDPDPTVIKHFDQYQIIELLERVGYTIKNAGQFGSITEDKNERLFIKATK